VDKYDDGIKRALEFLAGKKENYKNAVKKQDTFWRRQPQDAPPLCLSCGLTEEQESWLPEEFNTKEIHFDSKKMLINGLRAAMTAASGGCEALPSLRANMGCGIIPTLFGVEQTLFEDKMPWVLGHLPKEKLRDMTSGDLKEGAEFNAAMEHMQYMRFALEGTGVPVYPLDVQGAFDTAHIVYGDDIFYDLYDDEAFTAHLFDLAEQAVYLCVDRCFEVMAPADYVPHYNHMAIPKDMGGIKLSEDTSTLVNADIIEKFIAPSIDNIYARYGGGYVHWCGKNMPLFDSCLNREKAYGINFGNPEKYDMPAILADIVKAGKVYVGGQPKEPGESHFDCFVRILRPAYKNGVFHIMPAYGCSLEERDEVADAYQRAAEAVRKGE